MSPDRTHVFAYGSNLDATRVVSRVPSARVVGRASLAGYELRFHKRGWDDGTGKADAYHAGDDASLVHGVVYEVAESELPDLDVHETGYERLQVRLEVDTPAGPCALEAWVYLALPEVIDECLVPTARYLAHVLDGARAHGLPATLLERLERQAVEG